MNLTNQKIVSRIISSKKINNFKELKCIIEYWKENFIQYDDIEDFVNILEFNLPIHSVSKENIIKTMLNNDFSYLSNILIGKIPVYVTEIEYLKKLNTDMLRMVMYSFFIYAKLNPHETNWIRYDKDAIFSIADIECDENKKRSLLNECCKNGLDLTVVGSKSPIICFKLPIISNENDEIAFTISSLGDIYKNYKIVFEGENE